MGVVEDFTLSFALNMRREKDIIDTWRSLFRGGITMVDNEWKVLIEVDRETNIIGYRTWEFNMARPKFGGSESPPFPDGVWTQLTLIKEKRQYSLYFDNVLASSCEINATEIIFLENIYFGGDWISGPVGAKYDNI